MLIFLVGEAYVYDLGSVHGTVVNKQRVQPSVFVELHAGDQLKFGQSSRMYLFSGGVPRPAPASASSAPRPKPRNASSERRETIAKLRSVRAEASIEALRRARSDADDEEEEVPAEEASEGDDDEADAKAEQARRFYDSYYGDDKKDEDDSFFDRTGAVEAGRHGSRRFAESFETLTAKLSTLLSCESVLIAQIALLDKEGAAASNSVPDEDELEQYMAGIAQSFDSEKIQKKKNVLRDLQSERVRLQGLRGLLNASDAVRLSPEQQENVKRYGTISSLFASSHSSLFVACSFELDWQARVGESRKAVVTASVDTTPTQLPVSVASAAADSDDEPPRKRAKLELPSAVIGPQRRSIGPSRPKQETILFDSDDASKYDEWVPPDAQSGDGRTDLNSKLGY